jgi:hypothetical protein
MLASNLQVTFMRKLRRSPPNNDGKSIMGQVVYLYRSLAYRHAAADMLRKARTLPEGSERRAAHRYAAALRDMAETEAWLEGRTQAHPEIFEAAQRRAGC